jgi:short-subunit dehydrogenase
MRRSVAGGDVIFTAHGSQFFGKSSLLSIAVLGRGVAMSVELKPVNEQVIVITGASSGIGLATAHSAAEQGAKVVLAARSEEMLADVARQISDAGGQAAYVAVDVKNKDEVSHVAEVAVDRFGGFDSWVNNAGVGLYGRLDETTDKDARRLFDTNFWGAVYGSLIAAEHLRQRGGAIINVGSVASDNAIAMLGIYSASKHALRGFTDALRMELELERAPISVTLIKPTSINSPFPHHARNYTEQEPNVPPPVYQPDEVARAILYACSHAERDIYVGSSALIMSALGKFAPRTADWIGENIMAPREFRDEPPRHPAGTLNRPGGDGEIYGDHPGFVRPLSIYTRASMHPVITSAALLAAGAAVLAWVAQNTNRRHSTGDGLHTFGQ